MTTALAGAAAAFSTQVCSAQDLASKSLEDLLALEVTSVAKRPQEVQEASAAVFVIGREDIRRSGATSVPELRRMAPGLNVAKTVAGNAAVGARGFNASFSNKLLVLVDGRSVYWSSVASVLWNLQQIPVEEIERIEVIRGPGATLYGANAMNGVINIITKHAVDSLGVSASVQVDDVGSNRVFLRHGAQIGEVGALRLYGVASDERGHATLGGLSGRDDPRAWQAGFRFDAEPTQSDAVTLQGDFQEGQGGSELPTLLFGRPAGDRGGASESWNVLGRWTRQMRGDDVFSAQTYVTNGDYESVAFTFQRRVYDLDFSYAINSRRNATVVGAQYRRTENRIRNEGAVRIRSVTEDWYGAFVQNDLQVIPDRLTLTTGVKFEHNPKTGMEVQPTVRAIWTDQAGWSLWGAVSRAVRTPSDLEYYISADLRPALPIVLEPTRDGVEPEELIAYELGWRGRLTRHATLDLSSFYNRYKGLLIARGRTGLSGGAPALIFSLANGPEAESYGVEGAVDARLTSWWKLKTAISWAQVDFEPVQGAYYTVSGVERHAPRAQVSLRSMMDLTDQVQLDLWFRSVGALGDGLVDGYSDLDVRLSARPTPNLEFSLRGENLLAEQRDEFAPTGALVAPVALGERRVRLGLALRY